jgi:hypothetical protein
MVLADQADSAQDYGRGLLVPTTVARLMFVHQAAQSLSHAQAPRAD